MKGISAAPIIISNLKTNDMKKLKLPFFLAFLATLTTMAQEITGTVYDDQNIPLPGVSILLKGTTTGTITDFDGKYTIEADSGDILVFSYVGFNTQEKTVDGPLLNVTLQAGLELENVVVVGSRNANRTATDTPVPVDVLDVTELVQSAPQVSVTEILNYAAPSFSSNPQSISDGTDHIAPASLRGLGPDQVLVLINGKRRHKTGLVNVNGTFGRGSVGTDMTTIPSNSISRIEILRDGAAAQYGSDAIAGVINIVLKKSVNELQVDLTTGANFTSEHGPDKSVDGEKVNLGLNYGLPIGEDGGYINFTGNFNYRGSTNRMQEWEGTILMHTTALNGLLPMIIMIFPCFWMTIWMIFSSTPEVQESHLMAMRPRRNYKAFSVRMPRIPNSPPEAYNEAISICR